MVGCENIIEVKQKALVTVQQNLFFLCLLTFWLSSLAICLQYLILVCIDVLCNCCLSIFFFLIESLVFLSQHDKNRAGVGRRCAVLLCRSFGAWWWHEQHMWGAEGTGWRQGVARVDNLNNLSVWVLWRTNFLKYSIWITEWKSKWRI